MSYQGVSVEPVRADAGSVEPVEKAQKVELSPRLTTAHGAYLGTKYFAPLDGLRFLSITAVMALHGKLTTLRVDTWGHQGVSLFFVISGFLITTLLLRERSRDGTISLKSFYTRRVLRIFPLYYAVLALYVPIVYFYDFKVRGDDPAFIAEGRMFFHNLPYFLTYTGNLFMNASLPQTHFLHSWSLATEEQFYLIWPAIILLAGRKTLMPVIFMASVVVAQAIVWQLVGDNPGYLGPAVYDITRNIQPTICLGSLLAYGLHFPRPFKWFYPVLGRKWSGLVFFVLAGVCLWRGWDDLPLSFALVGIVGSVCIRERHPLRALLSNPVVVYIGTISYGMYLFNQLCSNAIPIGWRSHSQYLYFFSAAGLTILLATISYYFYERPFLRLKDRFRRVDAKPDNQAVPAIAA
jgi:peptidoglycan/LPS O-acetylase OafA/YrhL